MVYTLTLTMIVIVVAAKWENSMNILCYCGNENLLEEDDFGFEEFECNECGMTLYIPETEEEIEALNAQTRKEVDELRYTGKTRIMAIQETGEECCLRLLDRMDEELIDLIMAGYSMNHPEWKLFTEPEIKPLDRRNFNELY